MKRPRNRSESATARLKQMIFDPNEIVVLGGAKMTLRKAVIKVLGIPEDYRSLATIRRDTAPTILDFEQIQELSLLPVFSIDSEL